MSEQSLVEVPFHGGVMEDPMRDRRRDRDHEHCPRGCEHPQPFGLDDPLVGHRRLCGRCWFVYGELTDVVPCTPEVCDD